MPLLKIYTYPATVLTRKSETVTDFGAAQQKFFDDMIETMYIEDGVGLAAPQVGVSKRILVASPKAKPGEEEVFINPVIVRASGRQLGPEGCLSFPGITAEVYRATKILLCYQDRKGKSIERELKDFFARVLQHEMDHLDGITLLDRVDFNQRQHLIAEYEKTARDS